MKLGKHSLAELNGVHPDLVKVVKKAIEITAQDFTVHDGIRTLAEQRMLLKCGASKTLNSRHITGHAVDLVPYINGKLRWEWGPIYKIAESMRGAARHHGIPIVWGGCWDINFTESERPPEELVEHYIQQCRKVRGKKAFVDGPHYELSRHQYKAER